MEKDGKLVEHTTIDNASLELRGPKSPVEYSAEEEVALVRRLDWHILPPLSVLYLFCFLDRT